MARIEDLIDEIPDPELRAQVAAEVKHLKTHRRFGLVYEDHVPETVSLFGLPVRPGSIVHKRTEPDDDRRWEVIAVEGDTVSIRPFGTEDEPEQIAAGDLLTVKRFEEPIYPGLTPVGEVRRGPADKPFHSVINAESFHALQLLAYTHAGKVDVIYIDPPYNTGDKSWKYNNRFVDSNDSYRHSKWLAMMERRLRLAKRLLDPANSVLICAIDENERNRLGLLLEQVFPGVSTQMVTSVINPKGASLGRDFARVDEHLFFLYFGEPRLTPEVRDMLDEAKNTGADTTVKWSSLIRGGAKGIRTDSPGAYFPVFIDVEKRVIHSFGSPLPWGVPRESVEAPPGTVAVWPPSHPSGVEGRWGIGPERAAQLYSRGALRLGTVDVSAGKFPLSYLSSGIMEKVESGEILTVGRRKDGALIVRYPEATKITQPKTVWRMQSHNAGEYGSKLVSALLPNRKFPFPKSLYAVEDAIRFFVADKPDAVVLDFFAGSGTTAHAVIRLNRQDGGRRQSILVTNNEVSVDEAKGLAKQGHREGDPEWEAQGIFEHVTRPRLTAAVTGRTPDEEPVKGDYKFVDEFPMADGFHENVAFFRMDYLEPDLVELNRQYEAIAPMLWMAAGSVGSWEPWDGTSPWSAPEDSSYAVLFDESQSAEFGAYVEGRSDEITHAWIVTDSHSAFLDLQAELPPHVMVGQLYRDYLRNFVVNVPGVMR